MSRSIEDQLELAWKLESDHLAQRSELLQEKLLTRKNLRESVEAHISAHPLIAMGAAALGGWLVAPAALSAVRGAKKSSGAASLIPRAVGKLVKGRALSLLTNALGARLTKAPPPSE